MQIALLLLIFMCGKMADAINLDKLAKIDFSMLDEQVFDALVIHELEMNDQKFEEVKNLAFDFNILPLESQDCSSHVLKVISLDSLTNMFENTSNEFGGFVKNPCLSFLVTFEDFNALKKAAEDVRIPRQPYIFAVKQTDMKLELFEAQFFSKRIIPITSSYFSNQRRADMNGAILKIVHDVTDPWEKELVQIMGNHFNFSWNIIDFKGYGVIDQGEWNGAIKQLLEHEIDFGEI